MRLRLFCPCTASAGVIDDESGQPEWLSTRRFGSAGRLFDLAASEHGDGVVDLGAGMAIGAIRSTLADEDETRGRTTTEQSRVSVVRGGNSLYGTCSKGHFVTADATELYDAFTSRRRRFVTERVS